jgi:hypothetical protein
MRSTIVLGLALLAAAAAPSACSSDGDDDSVPQSAPGPGGGGGGGPVGGAGGGGGGGGAAGALVPGPGLLRNVDVTVIYPLPAPGQAALLLGPADAAKGGALLPSDAFEGGLAPELDERSPLGSDAERLASLRVVAVRFDPCEGQTAPPPASAPPCQADLRLVFQSLREGGGAVVAADGALHAFYRLNGDEFDDVLRELRAIRSERPGDPQGPLDVHPLLRGEGPDGPYARRLKALVTKHAGAANLTRLTDFRRLPQADFPQWAFEIRDRVGGAWAASPIATTGVTRQQVTAIVGGTWNADVEPDLTHADDVTRAFTAQRADMPAALGAVARVLNPRVHSSESIDCATCHLAFDVASFVERTQGFSVGDRPERFQSAYPLAAAPKSDLDVTAFDNLHMLSYSGASLSVTSRAANETAAVLEALNAR